MKFDIFSVGFFSLDERWRGAYCGLTGLFFRCRWTSTQHQSQCQSSLLDQEEEEEKRSIHYRKCCDRNTSPSSWAGPHVRCSCPSFSVTPNWQTSSLLLLLTFFIIIAPAPSSRHSPLLAASRCRNGTKWRHLIAALCLQIHRWKADDRLGGKKKKVIGPTGMRGGHSQYIKKKIRRGQEGEFFQFWLLFILFFTDCWWFGRFHETKIELCFVSWKIFKPSQFQTEKNKEIVDILVFPQCWPPSDTREFKTCPLASRPKVKRNK